MTNLSFRGRIFGGKGVLAFIVLVGTTALVCTPWLLRSQSSDQVHVIPRLGEHDAGGSSAGAGEDANPQSALRTKSLRVNVDLVLVPVTVIDAGHRPVTALQKQNFALYENSQEQQIRYFSTDEAPISVGVILDLSGTMGNKIAVARKAVTEFLKNANPEDDFFVITFAARPTLIADTTQSIDEVEAKLAFAKPAGFTALLDAIHLGIAKLRTARHERRALLIISDGGDNASRYTLRETTKMLEEADVPLYAIGIFDDTFPVFGPLENKLGQRLLTQVTDATGGHTIAAKHVAQLPDIAAAISLELRSQYVLGYRPSNGAPDGKWRKIKVRVASSSGTPPLQTYYRRGYLAPER